MEDKRFNSCNVYTIKKIKNILISAILAGSILTSLGSANVYGTDTIELKDNLFGNIKVADTFENRVLLNEFQKMDKMSIEELQNIIDEMEYKSKYRGNRDNIIIENDITNLKVAWGAVAYIVSKKGYLLALD